MTFSPYTELHNYFYVVPKHFHFRTGEPVSIKQFLSFPVLPAPGNHPSVFCLCGLTSWRYFIQIDALQYVSFCIWLLAVSLILSRFIHEAAHVRISFFFMAKLYSIVFCATICLSIHLLRDTGWFLILAIIQNVAVNVGVCIFFQICLFVFFDKYPEGELLDCMVVLVSVF